MVDEAGHIIDGDQLLFILASARRKEGRLQGPVVGTVMSNLGLEHALLEQGIEFIRAKVGDRYVLETLRATGGTIGGETSGHMICLDQTTTGDGLIAALQVLAVMKTSGRSLSELAAGMPKYPQKMLNVRTDRRIDLGASTAIQKAVSQVETELAETGRVVLRASGTEPMIRVMVEGKNEHQVLTLAERLAAVVAEAAA
jgi:phosphoglucosamine mutase